jgi:hypothetical protein
VERSTPNLIVCGVPPGEVVEEAQPTIDEIKVRQANARKTFFSIYYLFNIFVD